MTKHRFMDHSCIDCGYKDPMHIAINNNWIKYHDEETYNRETDVETYRTWWTVEVDNEITKQINFYGGHVEIKPEFAECPEPNSRSCDPRVRGPLN